MNHLTSSLSISKRLLLLLLLFGTSGIASANNLSVANLAYDNDTVSFDISWDNSWRNTGSSGSTENYDGVWVFVKFRDACAKDSLDPSTYSHMWLDTTVGSHDIPSGTTLEVGKTNISGNDRGMGVFLYRDADGSGTFTANNVTLKWDQTAQGVSGTDWDIKVFAIEMVYIPEGAFYVGDGVSSSSQKNFRDGSTSSPYLVSSEAAISLGTTAGFLNQFSTNLSGTLPAAYPKGYGAFWVMKYEITQQQYVEYLNTLSRTDQGNAVHTTVKSTMPSGTISIPSTSRYVLSATSSPSSRNGVKMPSTFHATQPIEFFNDLNNNGTPNEAADGQAIACNWLSEAQIVRYLIWSALRPMSELEFEKICRGPQWVYGGVIAYELAWSLTGSVSTNYTYVSSLTNAGTVNEAPSNSGNGLVHGSTGPGGAIRVGATYTGSTDRITAGSAYYGAADMTGNVYDFVIRVSSSNPLSATVYGNGGLTWSTPSGWSTSYSAYRGGSFNYGSTTNYLTISSRYFAGGSGGFSMYSTNSSNAGGRGAR